MKLIWLSFVDNGFKGVALVEVTDAQIAAAATELQRTHPQHDPVSGPLVAAAAREAWHRGCNPGGQVLTVEIDPADAGDYRRCFPLNRLLSRAEVEAHEAQIKARRTDRVPR